MIHMFEVYLQRQTVSVLLEKALVQLSPNDGSGEEAVSRLLSTEVTTGEHGESGKWTNRSDIT